MIEPIRGTQTEPIRANQRHSDGAHQSQSKALRRSPSEPIKGTQTEPIRANQGSVAEDLLALSVPIRADQSQSEPIKTYLPFPCMTPSENWPEYDAPSDHLKTP